MNKTIKIRVVTLFFGIWLLLQSYIVWVNRGLGEVLVWITVLAVFILSITYKEKKDE